MLLMERELDCEPRCLNIVVHKWPESDVLFYMSLRDAKSGHRREVRTGKNCG